MRYIVLAWLFLTVSLCMFLGVAPALSHDSGNEPDRSGVAVERRIDELIRQLGSEEFEVREKATRVLMECEQAAPHLRKALQSPDAEVARRAAQILEVFAQRKAHHALDRLAALAKAGAVDQAVELLVRRQRWDEDACWQVMAQLARKLVDLEQQHFDKAGIRTSEDTPFGDFRRYSAKVRPELVVGPEILVRDGAYLFRGKQVSTKNATGHSIIVASGPVHLSRFGSSVIFASGSVEVERDGEPGMVCNSVIVCDGDFKACYVANCLIIARGAVRCSRAAGHCLIVAGGGVKCSENISNCHIIAGGKADLRKEAALPLMKNTIKENEPNPFVGFVKFFDPAEAGITVEAAEGGVRVREAHEGKPFAQAGLKTGDAVIAIDGAEVASPDSFRRLLRRSLAGEEAVVFKVRRDSKVLEIPVRVKD